MKFRAPKLGFLRGLLALSVSLAVVGSSNAFVFAFFSNSSSPQLQSDETLLSANAFATANGVRLEWISRFDADNLGFNVYRLLDGRRLRINREIIPGSVFVAGANEFQSNRANGFFNTQARGAQSYGWLDPAGTADSVYYIESVSLARVGKLHSAVRPVAETGAPARGKLPRSTENRQQPDSTSRDSAAGDTSSFEVGSPVVEASATLQQMTASTIEDQWSVAAQSAVKIAIRKDGWYRVTQPQLAAVGFNPAVDARNLQLFLDGQEVAISTSQSGGLFGPSDYLEFFGRGLDVPTSDVRTYYLIAGSTAGKRVRGELQIDSVPTASPVPQPSPTVVPPGSGPKSNWTPWRLKEVVISLSHPISMPWTPLIIWLLSEPPAVAGGHPSKAPDNSANDPAPLQKFEPVTTPVSESGTGVPPVNHAQDGRATTARKKKKRSRLHQKRAEPRREYSHAVGATALAPLNFAYTVERRDRTVYFSSLLNGEKENWFGQVISGTAGVSQTINTPNPAAGATGPARLEIKLQGVTQVTHQIGVKLNDVTIGSVTLSGQSNASQTLDVPLSLLQNGANTLKFTPAAGTVSLVDRVRITYPHAFRADSDALKFSLMGTQSLQVDGFTSQNVQLIDYTDPFNVTLTKPEVTPSGGGYAITVPANSPKSKSQRLFYASATPDTAAAISLNQPSTLNLNMNAADFLIITTNVLSPSLAPLVAAREAQGMNVEVVNVEDVYDEFGYGLHGPQAIRDFLARANLLWTTKPKYVIFAGDASYDPRGYEGIGNFDLVPTKLVDATYNETASDDWLADFNDDGIADVPIGRLPVRTAADLDLLVSKIVNFTPVTPENAMLVADDPSGYYFNFEQANDQVQAQLPAGMAVQRVNVRVDGPGPAKANIVSGFNQGRALVNYTGHGNVDVWSGAAIFKSADATALTNGNKLSFVIVMDCLNGYYHAPGLLSLSEAFLKAPGGGAVAAFASSGLTLPDGQHQMSTQLYSLLYGAQPIALGDAIKVAKAATIDIDVRRTWIFFGDPSMKIR